MTNSASASATAELPRALLGALQRGTLASVSPETGIQILRSVGLESAQTVLESFGAWASEARMDRTAVADLTEREFWSLLSEFFSANGWGTLAHEHLHPGVISVSSPDWAESGNGSGPTSCHFTTGLLAEVMRLIAGQEVAVLEVECRSSGAASCRFLVGGPETLESVYSRLRGGTDMPRALEILG